MTAWSAILICLGLTLGVFALDFWSAGRRGQATQSELQQRIRQTRQQNLKQGKSS